MQDWRTKRTTRAAVKVEIEKMLDSGLPEKYTVDLYESKCGGLFQHELAKYPDRGRSVHGEAGRRHFASKRKRLRISLPEA